MPKYTVSARIVIPISLEVEANNAYLAEEKVARMFWRDAVREGFGSDDANIYVEGINGGPG